MKTFVQVTPKDVESLKAAAIKGPVSVAIEADLPIFQHYKGGIINSDQCGTKLDHGVLVVGFGSSDEGGD